MRVSTAALNRSGSSGDTIRMRMRTAPRAADELRQSDPARVRGWDAAAVARVRRRFLSFGCCGVLDPVRDLEYDEPGGPITHGRFHTMTGYNARNQMTPSDVDLFATLTMLTERFSIDYGILHTCTLDSMGHRFGHDCIEMDHACYVMDGMLAAFLPRWLKNGYEVIVTADHGQTDRGHHGEPADQHVDDAAGAVAETRQGLETTQVAHHGPPAQSSTVVLRSVVTESE